MGRIVGAMILAPVMAIAVLHAYDAAMPGEPLVRPAAARAGEADIAIHGPCRPGAFAEAPPEQAAHIPLVYPVRPAPDREALPLDTARAGETGHVCSRRRQETAKPQSPADWWGVIYGGTQKACGLDVESRRARTYAGPCRWGWVEEPHFRPSAPEPPPAGIAQEACGAADCGGRQSLSK